jgi:hypothetical protein
MNIGEVSGGKEKKLLLSKNAGRIQCVFFFWGQKLFQGKKNMKNSWFGFF